MNRLAILALDPLGPLFSEPERLSGRLGRSRDVARALFVPKVQAGSPRRIGRVHIVTLTEVLGRDPRESEGNRGK